MANAHTPATGYPPVSSPNDELILVDAADNPIGHLRKHDCHQGDGVLHRAFSLFVFNPAGELLLQQRSTEKPLWPLYWANTCCSHPRRGETMSQATGRRLHEELGVACDLQYLFKFTYQARYEDLGSEHETCWVYAGVGEVEVQANPHEVADWAYLAPARVDAELATNPARYTPWLKLEWPRVRAWAQRHLPESPP